MLLSEVSEKEEQEVYMTDDYKPVTKGTIRGVVAAFSNFGEQISAFALEPVTAPVKKEKDDV